MITARTAVACVCLCDCLFLLEWITTKELYFLNNSSLCMPAALKLRHAYYRRTICKWIAIKYCSLTVRSKTVDKQSTAHTIARISANILRFVWSICRSLILTQLFKLETYSCRSQCTAATGTICSWIIAVNPARGTVKKVSETSTGGFRRFESSFATEFQTNVSSDLPYILPAHTHTHSHFFINPPVMQCH